jgi:hypothetical protein
MGIQQGSLLQNEIPKSQNLFTKSVCAEEACSFLDFVVKTRRARTLTVVRLCEIMILFCIVLLLFEGYKAQMSRKYFPFCF